MPALLVVSTAPGAGRTAFAASFAARLVAQGAAVTLAKAFAGPDDTDTAALRGLVPDATVIEPVAVTGAPGPDAISQAAAAIGGAAGGEGVAVIEGLAGDHRANRALADALDARVVIVAGQGDDAAGAASAYGDRLVGVVVNNAPRYRGHGLRHDVVPALEAAGVPYLGAIPEDRRLIAVTARDIHEHLGGDWVEWEEHAGELVENVLIGGIVLDWGPHYFGSQENAAVLVRGDRPDIQIAALATPIKALVLTKGIRPVEYVYYEADRQQVPVTVVQQDTHEAAAALESVLERSRFDHPAKLARFLELAAERLDLGALEEALAQPVTG